MWLLIIFASDIPITCIECHQQHPVFSPTSRQRMKELLTHLKVEIDAQNCPYTDVSNTTPTDVSNTTPTDVSNTTPTDVSNTTCNPKGTPP